MSNSGSNTCTRDHVIAHGPLGFGSETDCRQTARRAAKRINAVLVEGGSAHYYRTLLDCIHLNAVRARIIRTERGESILDFPWSSDDLRRAAGRETHLST
jgi:hypothetical protein